VPNDNCRLFADGVTQMSDGKMASNPRTAGQRNLPFTARVRGGRVFFTGVFAVSLEPNSHFFCLARHMKVWH
jgi:hypothetical protein